MARTIVFVLFLVRCYLPQYAFAEDGGILVLYPETKIPYQEAYQQIIDGLRRSSSRPLSAVSIPEDYDLEKIQHWIDGNKDSSGYLVVLGQRAFEVARFLKHKHQLLVGALDILPGKNRTPGVSIHIDPSAYLEYLTMLSPHTTRLVVFYNMNNEDLRPLIEKEAHQYGIDIIPIPVTNIETTIRSIANTIKLIDPSDTAIWFTHNVIGLNTELIYPYILETSWRLRIPVFSGMISHTRRGFLFSLYPDYQGAGKELGQIIEEHAYGKADLNIRLTKATKFILNTRTAQHLGLSIDDKMLKRADVVFPAK